VSHIGRRGGGCVGAPRPCDRVCARRRRARSSEDSRTRGRTTTSHGLAPRRVVARDGPALVP
jgi:hypothetical protein